MFKNAFIIGSFQPFHNGHAALVNYALQADNVHIIIRGKDEKLGLHRFWSPEETVDIIKSTFADKLDKLTFHIVTEPKYNEKGWHQKVADIISKYDSPAIFGKYKNGLTLALEHNYDIPFVRFESQFNKTSGEILMDILHGDIVRADLEQLVPSPQVLAFDLIINSPTRIDPLLRDNKFAIEYAKTANKYAPFFVTADAVVKHNDKVLLVTRGKNPGLGMYAFPGGFVDHNERTYNAALRELVEETTINVSIAMLKDRMVKNKSYDDPNRSLRGRVITHAYLFDLSDIYINQIDFEAADDAANAQWVNIADLSNHNMFEDHYDILMDLVS